MAVREYKSNVFSMLMERKSYALQVYNALNDSHYEDVELVEIHRLENGIVLSVRNDASFFLDGYLNIYEHQSTFNANMALRQLIYYVDIIKPMVMNKDLFGKNRVKIPTPHFCVFYNGAEERPKEETFILSDSFEKKTDKPEIELICRIININKDVNPKFLESCSVLAEYMEFVTMVNEERKQGKDYREAIKAAIDRCIEAGILKEFLIERGNEVMEVMILDYTWERREELIRRDEYNDGYGNGYDDGLAQGIIKTCKNLNTTKAETVKQIKEVLNVDEKRAKSLVDQYWQEQ